MPHSAKQIAALEKRPATHVGNVIIFEGGFVRVLRWRERFLLWFAKRCDAVVTLPKEPW